jgi:hypothetical protein
MDKVGMQILHDSVRMTAYLTILGNARVIPRLRKFQRRRFE